LPELAHWVIWNIPGSAMGLPENVPGGATPSTPAGASQVSIDSPGHYFGQRLRVRGLRLESGNHITAQPKDKTAVRSYIQGLGESTSGHASVRGRSDEGPCN
jgi:hypothetical protein